MFCKFRYRENLKKNESLFEKFKENERLQKNISRMNRTEEQKARDKVQNQIRQARYRQKQKEDGIKKQKKKRILTRNETDQRKGENTGELNRENGELNSLPRRREGNVKKRNYRRDLRKTFNEETDPQSEDEAGCSLSYEAKRKATQRLKVKLPKPLKKKELFGALKARRG